MAWYPTHRTEWTDILELDWRIDIEYTVEPESIITMQSTDFPLTINFLAASDDLENVIHGSTASFSVYSDTDFQWAGLYADGDFKFRVSIYYNSTLYWRGFITSDYKEPYDGAPYPVTFFASDGLGYLKELPYKYTTTVLDDTYYNGRTLDSQVIFDILGKIGYTQFTEFVNLYESDHLQTVDDSPLDQTNCDVDVFKDLDCYTVLTRVLEKYKAKIRQKNGEIIIYRPVELKNATVYGRVFTSATGKTSTTITPLQLISRTGAVNDLRDINGGINVIQQAVKKASLVLDYGNKNSWMDSWDFDVNNYKSDGAGTFDNWINTGNVVVKHISEFVKDEKNGCAIRNSDLSGTQISQVFGANIKTSVGDRVVIEFDYNWFNDTGAATGATNISVLVTQGANQLVQVDDTFAEWGSGTLLSVTPNDVYDGSSDIPIGWGNGWVNFKREFDGIPADGTINIAFVTQIYTDIYNCYRNVRIYATSTEVLQKTGKRSFWQRISGGYGGEYQLKSKYYKITYEEKVENYAEDTIVVTNAVNGKEVISDYILGDVDVTANNIDNVLEQFAGSLGKVDRDTLAEAATAFDTAHDADYTDQSITTSSEDIIFTATTPGNDFTGATSITNTSGSLSGTVENTTPNTVGQPYIAPQARVDTVTLAGTGAPSGGTITIDGLNQNYTAFDAPSDVAIAFVTANTAYYSSIGIDLNYIGDDVVKAAQVAGVDFPSDTTFSANGGTITGTVDHTDPNIEEQEYIAAVARVDTITLTGTSGTADITVDGVTEEVEITESITPTVSWNTRGGLEALPLLQLIADEVKAQGSRPKHLIAGLPIIENNIINNTPKIDIIGNFVDTLNTIEGEPRTFVFNRGVFNVRDREWTMDLIEILSLSEQLTDDAGAHLTNDGGDLINLSLR